MTSSRLPLEPGHGGGRSCGIVGGGRLARHLSHYFRESGIDVRTWTRADAIPPNQALGDASVVLVLITDDAIAPFIEAHPALRSRVLAHCSGSLVTPLAHGMHPLMTFGPDLYGMAVYWAIPFVHDAGGPGLRDLFPSLPNPSFGLDPAHKTLYHAMVDLAGNLTPLLWERLFVAFETQLGLPREAAMMYLKRVVDVCEGPSPFPRTGPVARGDRRTVLRNLDALDQDPVRAVYEGFVRAVRPDLLAPDGGRDP